MNKKIILAVSALLMMQLPNTSVAQEQNAAAMANEQTAIDLQKKKDELLQVKPNDLVFGSADAKVTIFEYASLSCSHCATFHNTVYSKLDENYIKTGKVKFVYRDFPLDRGALQATQIVRCAPKEKADKFIKSMFKTQSNWVGAKNYLEVLSNIAKLGGMQSEEIDACLNNSETATKIVEAKHDAGTALEIRATPTFFINGKKHDGEMNFEEISKMIDAELAAN